MEDLSFGVERDVLAAILNALPVELSFVDKDDTVRYFSHENGDKIFPRTRGAIGMDVQNCHPEKSVHLVNRSWPISRRAAGRWRSSGSTWAAARCTSATSRCAARRASTSVRWRWSRTSPASRRSPESGGCSG